MGKHPTYIPGYYGTIKKLAEAVENLPYDMQSTFFRHYTARTQKRADNDFKNRKPDLANRLYQLISDSHKIKEKLDGIWKICESRTTKINRD